MADDLRVGCRALSFAIEVLIVRETQVYDLGVSENRGP